MQKYREYFYQFILILLLFIFMVFDEENQGFELGYMFIALDYIVAAFVINYVLFPRFYYKKRIFLFWLYSILLTFGVIVIEELLWEPLFLDSSIKEELHSIAYSFTDAIPVMAILVGFKFSWDTYHRQKELDALKQMMAENEMRFLKSQINPHFLFNNLNNLYAYAIENSPKTPSLIHGLSSVLRYMLYDCREKYVPLKNEIENLQNFVELNRLQMEHRGSVDFKATNILEHHRIAPLILMVFVENAFKHSLSSLSEDVKIVIRVDVQDDVLHFCCENNYSSETNLDNLSSGIGLKNVVSQLEYMYQGKHKLKMDKKDNLYVVFLTVNLKNLPDD